MITLLDESGNELRIKQPNPDRYPHMVDITLKISGDSKGRERNIGQVDKLERILYISRTRSKHLLQKANSYGFSYRVISESGHFDVVRLTDEHGTYLIPKKTILEKGKFLWFKEQGFERQIFLDIPTIEQCRQL